ncbi:MAG: pyruvate dehydrogenase (acetyl-transferring) E1 component subunit alpha [Firmicutes bacterium]|nr:pyruvate dehydrogenase (acetyl-transferring) E1 component subunit alpha [Bacillota bacterium]
MQPDRDVLLDLYRRMLQIRRFEEAAADAYQRGFIPGFIHLYIGEEAVASGVSAHLRRDDVVFSTHRGHGHALAKGASAREVMAELWGRRTGCSHGKGGSMHLFAPEAGLLGTNGIVGPSITLAAGAGYTFKQLGTDRVGVAFFGDGAVSNSTFHEGINMVALWDLPVIFVCENNQYATQMPFSQATRNRDVAGRAAAYGLPGVSVDGNDVVSVYEAAGRAVRRARSGEGPTLIECRTYRTVGHHQGDPGTDYRTREEVEEWKARCPIKRLSGDLLSQGWTTGEELSRVEEAVRIEIEDAVEFARKSPWPEPQEATAHVYGGV